MACVYLSVFQGARGIRRSFSRPLGLACTGSPVSAAPWSCISDRVRLVVPGVQPQHWGFQFQCPLSKSQVFWLPWWTQPLLDCSWFCSCPWPSQLSAILALIHCSVLTFWTGCGDGSPAHAGTSPDELFLPSVALVIFQTTKKCSILKALKANGLF